MNVMSVLGICGSVAGLIGGLAGTYLAVQSACGPREQSFMRRGAVLCWLGVILYFVAMAVLPGLRPVICAVTALALPVGLRMWSRRQREVRAWERAVLMSNSSDCGSADSEGGTSLK